MCFAHSALSPCLNKIFKSCIPSCAMIRWTWILPFATYGNLKLAQNEARWTFILPFAAIPHSMFTSHCQVVHATLSSGGGQKNKRGKHKRRTRRASANSEKTGRNSDLSRTESTTSKYYINTHYRLHSVWLGVCVWHRPARLFRSCSAISLNPVPDRVSIGRTLPPNPCRVSQGHRLKAAG